MAVYKDQLQRDVEITTMPKRIISVVPSQTELLYELGLDERVVGITNFCIHPKEWHRNKTRIGGTKNLKIDRIRELNPDLIIANKEENTKEEIELLCTEFPVWISDISQLDEALEMIQSIGEITDTQKQSEKIVREISSGFQRLEHSIKLPQYNCLYLIWRKPYMAAGTDTIIHHMLSYCGLQNVLTSKRYPVLDLEEIKQLNPEVILLSSEPYPFTQKHMDEIQSICPSAKIILCDGEYFSWYGSRLMKAPQYFEQVITTIWD